MMHQQVDNILDSSFNFICTEDAQRKGKGLDFGTKLTWLTWGPIFPSLAE